jgi:hypothetical protein
MEDGDGVVPRQHLSRWPPRYTRSARLKSHVEFDPVAAGPPPLEPTTRLDDVLLTSTSSSIPHLSHPLTMSTAVDGELEDFLGELTSAPPPTIPAATLAALDKYKAGHKDAKGECAERWVRRITCCGRQRLPEQVAMRGASVAYESQLPVELISAGPRLRQSPPSSLNTRSRQSSSSSSRSGPPRS